MTSTGPDEFTTVPLIYDSDDRGFGGIADMDGPEVGRLRYRQNKNGALEVRVDLRYGHPNVTYDLALTAGASHDLGTGWVGIGALTTGSDGAGSSVVVVPVSVLRKLPFGAGSRTDHLDVIQIGTAFTAGVFAAGAVNYFVCERRVADEPDVVQLRRGSGDPIGSDQR